jgi:hypothetical protein
MSRDDPKTQQTVGSNQLVAECLAQSSRYSAKEIEFLQSIQFAGSLTEAQGRWLASLVDPVDFEAINSAARAVLPALVKRWLPDGRALGKEWVAKNPKRADSSAGSFSINLNTGAWGDFATPHRGGDPVSLAAYLYFDGDQFASARAVRKMLGG